MNTIAELHAELEVRKEKAVKEFLFTVDEQELADMVRDINHGSVTNSQTSSEVALLDEVERRLRDRKSKK